MLCAALLLPEAHGFHMGYHIPSVRAPFWAGNTALCYGRLLATCAPGRRLRSPSCRLGATLAQGADVDSIAQSLEKTLTRGISEASEGLKLSDLVEELSANGVARRPWTSAFRALASDPVFIEQCWGKLPFKTTSSMPFAVDCFKLEDLTEFAKFYPLVYAGAGTVLENGGWMMARLDKDLDRGAEPMSASDVEASLSRGTVSLNSAGFFIAPLASICSAMLEAFQLPIWLNIYITEAGKQSSAPCHTDKQDVVAVQSTGSKRWRVFAPPSPAAKIASDPWARGKGQDILSIEDELGEPLLDVVMEPGQLLYIPAGFPHVTDTDVESTEPSVHLTLGVDTHVWDLNYASMRDTALKRKKLPTTLDGSFSINKLDLEPWRALHTALPLGFAAAPVLASGDQSAAASSSHASGAKTLQQSARRLASAHHNIARYMATECARRMMGAEPKRWGGYSEKELVAHLDLEAVAARYLDHYQRLMATQRKVYADASLQLRAIGSVFERAQPYLNDLDSHMAALAAWADGCDDDAGAASAAVAVQVTSPAAAAAGSKGMGKGGGGMGMGGGKPSKKAGKKKK